MSGATSEDRERAGALIRHEGFCALWLTRGKTCQCSTRDSVVAQVAAALAEERERGIDIGLQNATSIDHYEVGHCCRLCGETWPCDRARTVGLL